MICTLMNTRCGGCTFTRFVYRITYYSLYLLLNHLRTLIQVHHMRHVHTFRHRGIEHHLVLVLVHGRGILGHCYEPIMSILLMLWFGGLLIRSQSDLGIYGSVGESHLLDGCFELLLLPLRRFWFMLLPLIMMSRTTNMLQRTNQLLRHGFLTHTKHVVEVLIMQVIHLRILERL